MRFLDLFENWANTEKFDTGAVIFSENESRDVLYVVLDGEVELSFHGERLGVEKRGGIIGEMALIGASTRNASATALTPVSAACISPEQFKELIDRDSGFAFHAMATLANRLRAADGFIGRKLVSEGV